tara:strand:- start:605 stop:1234 length:630 start_codon:yes stop_codon:yes gene_type:complete
MPKSDKRIVEITHEVLSNWHPDMTGKKSCYIRDAKVNLLLCCFSKRGMHSWAYDYSKKGVHKSKVFGYYPAMSITQARKTALEIKKQVVDADKDYDEVFEVVRYPSHVYFLEDKKGLIKIGRSTDWISRINELIKSTEGLRLIGTRKETDTFNETKLHNLYRKYRQPNNEYFNDKDGFIKLLLIEALIYNKPNKILKDFLDAQERRIYC